MRRNKEKLGSGAIRRGIGGISIGLLGIIALALLLPTVYDTSYAEELPIMTTGVNTNMTALVRSSVAVAVSSKVDLDVTPKSTGAFSTSSANLKVTTNNTTGYAVYLQTADNTSELKATNPHVDKSIAPVNGTMTEGSFASNLNTWGYAVGSANSNTEYKAVPQAGDEAIVRTTGISREDDYNLSFAVAVGTDLPAGLYTNQLLVSVVANPIEVRSLNDITYMQDMTAEICAITFEGETKQLIDSRDGKSYWVAKLKDGNCWMTQNLALDIDTNESGNAVAVSESGNKVELGPNNTDIDNVWTEATKTKTEIPLPNTGNNSEALSWNLGKLVLAKATSSSLCPKQTPPNNGQSYPNTNQYNSAFTGQNIAETCSSQVVDVSTGWSAGYTATATSSVDEANKTYDSHYLFGNYYQWDAATASTAVGVSGTSATNANGAGLTNASGSICPKGWQLPKAGRNSSAMETVFGVGPGQSYDIEGSFYHLLKAYGYDSEWTNSDGSGFMSINSADRTANLAGEPMFFTRNGRINPDYGSLQHGGSAGYARSSTAIFSNTQAYTLDFNNSVVGPSNNYYRYYGLPVRCLAK